MRESEHKYPVVGEDEGEDRGVEKGREGQKGGGKKQKKGSQRRERRRKGEQGRGGGEVGERRRGRRERGRSHRPGSALTSPFQVPCPERSGPYAPSAGDPMLILTMGSLSAGKATAHGAASQLAVRGCRAAVLRAWWVWGEGSPGSLGHSQGHQRVGSPAAPGPGAGWA